MKSSTSRNMRRESVLWVWLAGSLILLSCGALGTGNPPQPTSAATASPPASATPENTRTPTPAGTPTLGARSIWRGSRIAFASNRSGRFQIYLMKPGGTDLTQLTDSAGDNTSPAWSADAQHIAFASTRDGNSEIYIMNPDGSRQKNLTDLPSNDRSPVWLPGNKIAFISDRKGLERIIVMNADGSDIQSYRYTSINSTSRMLCLTWLSEGMVSFTVEESGARKVRIVDTSNGEVWTPSLFSGEHDRSCPVVPSLVTNPSALFVSNRDGHEEIYKLDMQTEAEVQLTKNPSPSLGVSRSSDEGWIAFYSRRSGNWDIYVMDSAGKNQWDITNDPADDIQPAWEPY